MKNLDLSLRMKTVADMVRPGGVVCDVGCDHAFVAIYLAERGISDRVIASDVRSGPVAIARENIEKHGLTDRIDVRLGDGLSTVSAGEVDTVIMAGMGGLLMIDIIKAGYDVTCAAGQLILQPQSEVEQLRRFIAGCGFTVSCEDMVKDAGKYYVVMDVDTSGKTEALDEGDAREMTTTDFSTAGGTYEGLEEIPNNADVREIYFKYGKYLIESKNQVLAEYLGKRRDTLAGIADGLSASDTENARKRRAELAHELDCIDKALMMVGQ